MKRLVLALCMLVVLAVTVVVVIVMGLAISGKSFSDIFGEREWFNLNLHFGIKTETVLISEDTIPAAGVRVIDVSARAYGVKIRAANSSDITVRQYGADDDEAITGTVSDGVMTIDVPDDKFYGNIGVFMVTREIVIDVPADYGGDMKLAVKSGGIHIEDAFNLANADISATSGGVKTDAAISCAEEFSLIVTSGGAKLADVTAEKFYVKTTSGGITAQTLRGGGDVICTSGGIKIDRFEPTADTVFRTTSGGAVVGIADDYAFKLEGQASSGGISCDYGGVSGNRLSASHGDNPALTVTVNTSSGGVKIRKA